MTLGDFDLGSFVLGCAVTAVTSWAMANWSWYRMPKHKRDALDRIAAEDEDP